MHDGIIIAALVFLLAVIAVVSFFGFKHLTAVQHSVVEIHHRQTHACTVAEVDQRVLAGASEVVADHVGPAVDNALGQLLPLAARQAVQDVLAPMLSTTVNRAVDYAMRSASDAAMRSASDAAMRSASDAASVNATRAARHVSGQAGQAGQAGSQVAPADVPTATPANSPSNITSQDASVPEAALRAVFARVEKTSHAIEGERCSGVLCDAAPQKRSRPSSNRADAKYKTLHTAQ